MGLLVGLIFRRHDMALIICGGLRIIEEEHDQGIISKWDIDQIPVFQAYNYRQIHINQLIDL